MFDRQGYSVDQARKSVSNAVIPIPHSYRWFKVAMYDEERVHVCDSLADLCRQALCQSGICRRVTKRLRR